MPVQILGKEDQKTGKYILQDYSEGDGNFSSPQISPRFYAGEETLPADASANGQLYDYVIPNLKQMIWKPPPIANQAFATFNKQQEGIKALNTLAGGVEENGYYNFDKDIKEPCYYSRIANDLKVILGLTPQRGFLSQRRISLNQTERKQFLQQQNLSIAQIHARNIKTEELNKPQKKKVMPLLSKRNVRKGGPINYTTEIDQIMQRLQQETARFTQALRRKKAQLDSLETKLDDYMVSNNSSYHQQNDDERAHPASRAAFPFDKSSFTMFESLGPKYVRSNTKQNKKKSDKAKTQLLKEVGINPKTIKSGGPSLPKIKPPPAAQQISKQDSNRNEKNTKSVPLLNRWYKNDEVSATVESLPGLQLPKKNSFPSKVTSRSDLSLSPPPFSTISIPSASVKAAQEKNSHRGPTISISSSQPTHHTSNLSHNQQRKWPLIQLNLIKEVPEMGTVYNANTQVKSLEQQIQEMHERKVYPRKLDHLINLHKITPSVIKNKRMQAHQPSKFVTPQKKSSQINGIFNVYGMPQAAAAQIIISDDGKAKRRNQRGAAQLLQSDSSNFSQGGTSSSIRARQGEEENFYTAYEDAATKIDGASNIGTMSMIGPHIDNQKDANNIILGNQTVNSGEGAPYKPSSTSGINIVNQQLE